MINIKGGIVFGYERINTEKEKIYCITNNTHTVGIGATRSGKTRCVVLQSIGTLGLAGESMVITDPKGELYDYTSDFLRAKDYDIKVLNFKETKKSDKYNFLQPVIDAINKDDIQDAVDKTWDITESLMPDNDKGEPIWKNGEAAIIASAIMCVVYENKNYYKYQNLANVSQFITEMSINRKDERGNFYVYFERLREYLKEKSSDDPAIALLSISEVAHPKTRSSFYTSALTTLRLFSNININSITSDTNISLKDIARNKTALYIILPDEKTTYYSIASLFIHQLYISLVAQADRMGGSLGKRVNFILDEFGNFTKVPNMDTKLTVAGSRNIRFNLFLQSFKQLDEKYGKELSSIIRYNCENWLYIQTDDVETLDELSKRLGKYTTTSYSLSNNSNGGTLNLNTSSGSSVQLIGRELLTADEIKRIKRPYLLYLSRGLPAVMNCPDISLWNFNDLFSMGDEEHNRRLRFMKGLQMQSKIKVAKKVAYWDKIVYLLQEYKLENEIKSLNDYIKELNELVRQGETKAMQALMQMKMQLNVKKSQLEDVRFKISEIEKEDENERNNENE